MKWIKIIMLGFWIIIGLYFGIGGIVNIQSNNIENEKHKLGLKVTNSNVNTGDTNTVIYDGISFKNKKTLEEYLNSMPLENFKKLYPISQDLPDFMGQIITALAFGLLGSVTRIVLKIAFNAKQIEEVNYISQPILGMLTGLVVMGLSYVIPTLLSKNAITLDPLSLMFFSLFAGIYNKEFYEKLQLHFINKILSK